MEYLINRVLQSLQSEAMISDEEFELYQYGIHLMCLKALHYCTTLLLGVLLEIPLETTIFLCTYSLLRSYTGGYHAKKSITCIILSILMVLSINVAKDFVTTEYLIIAFIISIIIMYIGDPIASDAKPMNKNEIKNNKTISRYFLLLSCFLFITFYYLYFYEMLLPLGLAVIYCAFFLVISKLQLLIKLIRGD